MSKVTAILTNIMSVLSIFYIIVFLLCVYSDAAGVTALHTIVLDHKVAIPCFIVSVLSFIGLGKAFAHEEIEQKRYRLLRDMQYKQQELIKYVRLAKLVTNKDADTLITEYIERLDKEYNVSTPQ